MTAGAGAAPPLESRALHAPAVAVDELLAGVGAVQPGTADGDDIASRAELSVTPEGVVVEVLPAGLPSRIAAFAVDLLIASTFSTFVIAIAGQVAIATGSDDLLAIVLALVSGLSIIGYPILCEALWNGRTIGKLLAGLRVVTVDGAPIRPRHAAVRGIVLVAEVGTFGLLGIVAALLSRRGRRLGDLAAGTVVVRDRTELSVLARPLRFGPPPGWERLAATVDTGAIDHATYALLRSFSVRAGQLAPEARAQLAQRLAAFVASRLRMPVPPPESAESYLLTVLAASQHRNETWRRLAGARA